MPGRAVGAGAGRLRAARARAAREVPQLLLRSHAARGLLAAAEVSPHDVVDARLRARRSAGDRRRRRARGAVGAARAQSSRARRGARRRSGLTLLPREGERLWTLNAVRVPDGVDEAAVRKHLLDEFNIEIGAGLGPLAGKIWRVGLMGASSSPRLIVLLRGALESALAKQAHVPDAARARWQAVAAIGRTIAGALAARASRSSPTSTSRCPTSGRSRRPTRRRPRSWSCARARRARKGQHAAPRAALDQLRRHLAGSQARGARRRRRCVLAARRRGLRAAAGVARDWTGRAGRCVRGGSTITQQLAKNLYLSPSKNPLRKLRELDHRAAARSRAEEGADSRAVSERDRVGRRHLRRRGGGAHVLSNVRRPALGSDRVGAARRGHHQPARAQPCTSDGAAAAAAAAHPAAHGRGHAASRVGRRHSYE